MLRKEFEMNELDVIIQNITDWGKLLKFLIYYGRFEFSNLQGMCFISIIENAFERTKQINDKVYVEYEQHHMSLDWYILIGFFHFNASRFLFPCQFNFWQLIIFICIFVWCIQSCAQLNTEWNIQLRNHCWIYL